MSIDVNCDMGEGMDNDSLLMPYISSANIACGFHAGDDKIIKKTIALCLLHNVAIGAHPGFNDKPNFGRISLNLTEDELHQLMWKQLEIMQTHCRQLNANLHHVKPHGALYNIAVQNKTISAILAKVVKDFNPKLVYYGLSGSSMIDEAKRIGLTTANEVFADRTYQPDGSLTPRPDKRALIDNPDSAVKQVIGMIETKSVMAIDGTKVGIHAETVCIHGDGPSALLIAKAVHNALKLKGIEILAPQYN